MPHTFSAKRWQAKIRNAAKAGVSSVAIDFQRDVVLQLSKPGTGKFYSRSKHIAGGNRRTALDFATVQKILDRETERVKQRAFDTGRARRRNLRDLGIHRASAPGQPPAADHGTLRRSVESKLAVDKTRINDRNPRLDFIPIALRTGDGIGATTTQRYGKWLEEGTPRVAARPWAGRTVREYVGARKHIKTFNAAFRVRLGATR